MGSAADAPQELVVDGPLADELERRGVHVRELHLAPNQVRGLTRTDLEWSAALEAALTATRRDDLQHGSNAAYMAGCVCCECRGHQRQRMAKNRG
jgi:hypothetical protein